MEIETDTTFETKAGIPADAAVTHAELSARLTNSRRRTTRGFQKSARSTSCLRKKIGRLDSVIAAQTQRLEVIELKQARPAIGSEPRPTEPANQPAIEHKAAFDAYVRGGDTANLRALEQKALSGSSNPDGGFLVPPEIEHKIGERLFNVSPIRSLASIRVISSNIYKKPMMATGPVAGWVGETDARTQTTSPTLDELSFPAMELYAMPAATTTLLEDSAVDIDEWLAQEVDRVFAAQEGAAFVTGDGNNKPKGYVSYNTWRIARGPGATSDTCRRALRGLSRQRRRPMCWSISSSRSRRDIGKTLHS